MVLISILKNYKNQNFNKVIIKGRGGEIDRSQSFFINL